MFYISRCAISDAATSVFVVGDGASTLAEGTPGNLVATAAGTSAIQLTWNSAQLSFDGLSRLAVGRRDVRDR